MSELYTPKELGFELKRSAWYVYAMKKAGFSMPGGTATVEEAREWLRRHPDFTARGTHTREKRRKTGNIRQL